MTSLEVNSKVEPTEIALTKPVRIGPFCLRQHSWAINVCKLFSAKVEMHLLEGHDIEKFIIEGKTISRKECPAPCPGSNPGSFL